MYIFLNSLLILCGVVVLILSIIKVKILIGQLHGQEIQKRWKHLSLFMTFFLSGYFFALGLILRGNFELLSATTSVIFAAGAFFVFLVVRVSALMGRSLLNELSERKKAASLLTAIIESTADGILVVNSEGRIVYFNQKFAQMWSLPETILASKDDNQAIAFVINQLKEPDQFIKKVNELYQQPQAISNDVLEFKDGKVFERYSQPQKLDGLFVGRVWSFIDVTARISAEIEVKKLNQELEKKVRERTFELESANKDLESFNYSISHDLRAPLRAINGFTQILKEDYEIQIDENGKQILNKIISNTNKMGKLIDDFLAFSKLGRNALHRTKIDSKILIDTLLKELDKSFLNAKAIIQIKELLPLYGDPVLIKQLFFNLISNALKYSRTTPNPTIEIGSSLAGDETIFYIKDNGIGFDMQYYGKLFKVFQRLVAIGSYEGTGVGLAICQRIVSLHNGRIWAEGKVNEGATFYFALPNMV